MIFTGVLTNFISTLITKLLGIEWSAYNTVFPINLVGFYQFLPDSWLESTSALILDFQASRTVRNKTVL